jgi:hypothetical protein
MQYRQASSAIQKTEEWEMSIQKKSLISNRSASKKANLTKAKSSKVSSTKLAQPVVGSQLQVSLAAPRLAVNQPLSMIVPKISTH